MIIDSLTHVTPDGRWFQTKHDASLARLLGEMDAAGVDRSVVVALAGVITNDFVLDACQRHADRLIPGASFNPAATESPASAASALRAELRDASFPVLKLHPRLNHYDPLDGRCIAVLEELATWPRPPRVWLDTLFHYRGGTLRKPPVEAIHELVNRVPGVTFVLLHGTGAYLLQLAQAVRDCPNVFIDVSFTLFHLADTSVEADLRHLFRTLDSRLVVGSDFPEYGPVEMLKRFDGLTQGLAASKRANLLGGNLANAIGLGSFKS